MGYTFAKPDWLNLNVVVPEGEHVVMFRAWSPDMGKPEVPPEESGTIRVDNVSYMPHLVEGFEEGALEWDTAEFEGDGSWVFDSAKAHEGSMSLRSPDLNGAGESSRLKFEVSVPRRGSTINFWYYSELASDSFNFKINDKTLLSVNNSEGEWKQLTRVLPPGMFHLEWEFTRGGGGGKIWLDDIAIKGK